MVREMEMGRRVLSCYHPTMQMQMQMHILTICYENEPDLWHGCFLPSYRLLPEHKFVDSLEDVYRAYIYLVGVRGVKPQDIVLAGLSSGAGWLVRLLQRIQEATGSSTLAPTGTDDAFTSTFTSSSIMPSGAFLSGLYKWLQQCRKHDTICLSWFNYQWGELKIVAFQCFPCLCPRVAVRLISCANRLRTRMKIINLCGISERKVCYKSFDHLQRVFDNHSKM